MRRDEALAILKAHFPELSQRFGIEALYLFGSTARNEAHCESDVDVLVEFKPDAGVGLFELARLQMQLETLLGCSVDVVTPGGLKRQLRERILREAVRVATPFSGRRLEIGNCALKTFSRPLTRNLPPLAPLLEGILAETDGEAP
jgi:uncharacterized protein